MQAHWSCLKDVGFQSWRYVSVEVRPQFLKRELCNFIKSQAINAKSYLRWLTSHVIASYFFAFLRFENTSFDNAPTQKDTMRQRGMTLQATILHLFNEKNRHVMTYIYLLSGDIKIPYESNTKPHFWSTGDTGSRTAKRSFGSLFPGALEASAAYPIFGHWTISVRWTFRDSWRYPLRLDPVAPIVIRSYWNERTLRT